MDSGATSHICFSRLAFSTMRSVKNTYVTLPNHKRIFINFIGTVKFGHNLKLEDMLYVPNFKFNLMSASALMKDPYIDVRFCTNTCVVQDMHNQMMIGRGRRIVGLYIMSVSISNSRQDNRRNSLYDNVHRSISANVNKVTAHTWHHRLGHL